MELKAVKKLIAESPTIEVKPGNYLMCYDINTWTMKQMREAADVMAKEFGMHVVLLGYDAHYTPEPIQFYKVSA